MFSVGDQDSNGDQRKWLEYTISTLSTPQDEFIWGKMKIYLHFPSYLNSEITQEIHHVHLQWHHMSHKTFPITRHEIVCSKLYSAKQQQKYTLASLVLCEGNPPVTGGFPSQRASNASWKRYHDVIQPFQHPPPQWVPLVPSISTRWQPRQQGNISSPPRANKSLNSNSLFNINLSAERTYLKIACQPTFTREWWETSMNDTLWNTIPELSRPS